MKNNRPRIPGRYSLPLSFGFALAGLWHALRYERNLRIHFSAAAYVLYFSGYYSLSRAEYAIVVLMIGFVITCELFNTAIENTVDLESPVYNSIAKVAKDVAAGAVLVSAVTSVVMGICLFWQPVIILRILEDIRNRLYLWIPLVSLTVLWIFWPKRKKKH